MRQIARLTFALGLFVGSFALVCIAQPVEKAPTIEEIEKAYQEKGRKSGGIVHILSLGRSSKAEVRGWSLQFRFLNEKRLIDATARNYQALAKRDGWCAEYLLTDTQAAPTAVPKIRMRLVVDSVGLGRCKQR